MTDTIKQALEALIGLDEAYCRAGNKLARQDRNQDRQRLIAARAAIATLRAEGEVKGEAVAPFAWWRHSYVDEHGHWDADVQICSQHPDHRLPDNGYPWSPLYTTPPATLTHEQVREAVRAELAAWAPDHASEVETVLTDFCKRLGVSLEGGA